MITAKEAKEIAEPIFNKRCEKIISRIDKRIRKTSKKGKFDIQVQESNLPTRVKYYLEDNGFRIWFEGCDRVYRISWFARKNNSTGED